MKILVLQHDRVEHPGALRRLLSEDGHAWVPVELDAGEPLPALDGFHAVWAMGGAMDVWQRDRHPWLAAEKALIREAVAARGLPYFGFCLGHQLLAEALGGRVAPAALPEIGVMEVTLTEAGAASALFEGQPERFYSLQWHGAEVVAMPQDARCLAVSPACAVQAMQWRPRAVSVHFHPEIEPGKVDVWAAVPAHAETLDRALGPDGVDRLRADCVARADDFAATVGRLYRNWMHLATAPGTGP